MGIGALYDDPSGRLRARLSSSARSVPDGELLLYDSRVAHGYREIEHTADYAFELWADSEEELLVAGALAVTEILTGGAEIADRAGRDLSIESLDAADRLVQWLNEIIVAAIADGFLFRSAAIELDGGGRLRARVRGETGGHERVVVELKSATYHELLLQSTPTGWRARVIIDV